MPNSTLFSVSSGNTATVATPSVPERMHDTVIQIFTTLDQRCDASSLQTLEFAVPLHRSRFLTLPPYYVIPYIIQSTGCPTLARPMTGGLLLCGVLCRRAERKLGQIASRIPSFPPPMSLARWSCEECLAPVTVKEKRLSARWSATLRPCDP